jgi:hypothetical protein
MTTSLPVGPSLTMVSASSPSNVKPRLTHLISGLAIALALDDLAREDDVFEIEDREVGIIKPFRGMKKTT